MGEFPNKATQFKGGERRGKVQPIVGARRAKKLRKAAVIYATAFPPQPIGSLRQWLKDVISGAIVPNGPQLYAAQILAKFPGADAEDQARSIINLDGLTDMERMLLAKLLLKTTMPKDGQAPLLPAPAVAAPPEAPPEPRPGTPSPEQQRLLAKLRSHDPAAAARYERDWPQR